MTGALVEIPLIALAVWTLARLGVGAPDAPLLLVVRRAAVFAGPAAVLTAGGIGRLAAYAYVDGGRRRAVARAARAHAVAGAGLVLIAAIPLGHVPDRPGGWLAFPAAGLVAGAIAGALIAWICTSHALAPLADVWSLARRPSAALRSLLEADDLARLGAALRTRTTNLFEGIFEPAAPPPTGAEAAAAAAKGGDEETAPPADAAAAAPAKPSTPAAPTPAAPTPAAPTPATPTPATPAPAPTEAPAADEPPPAPTAARTDA